MSAPTPRPWAVAVCVDGSVEVRAGKTRHALANLGKPGPYDNKGDEGRRMANARLMAAAPDLLAALLTLADYMEESHQEEIDSDHHGDGPTGCSYCEGIAAANAAIARAEGVAQ